MTEYLNNGGTLIAMGQDLAATLGADVMDAKVGSRNFLYVYRLGANYIQDSVSNKTPLDQLITSSTSAPTAFADVVIDLTKIRKTSGGGELSGTNEMPSVSTLTSGLFLFDYDFDQNALDIAVSVDTTSAIEVTAVHIHGAPAGVNGPVVRSLDFDNVLPTVVTDTLEFVGTILDFTDDEIDRMLAGELYINVHTTTNPSGEVRGQLEPDSVPHSLFVDEIDNDFHDNSGEPDAEGTSESNLASTPILQYQGPYNDYDGTVTMAHRDQVLLERPGTDYSGRSIYATFGLEGMSNDLNAELGYTPTTRSELIQLFLDWSWAEPAEVSVANTTSTNNGSLTTFEAISDDVGVRYRWDFGDGSNYVTSDSASRGHSYVCSDAGNVYTVRVEMTDALGIVSLGSGAFDVSDSCQIPTTIEGVEEPDLRQFNDRVFLPLVTQ